MKQQKQKQQKRRQFIITSLVFSLGLVFFMAAPAAAQTPPATTPPPASTTPTAGCDTFKTTGGSIGTAVTRLFAQATPPPATPPTTPPATPPPADNSQLVPAPCPTDCPKAACIIDDYVNPIIKVLIATTGIIVIISVIMGGIQYSTAGGDSGKVSAAKARITKAMIAFLTFLLLYAGLNYLVPGGV